MRLFRQKKGQVEEPINWVFILVAGGVILLFFGILIFRFQSVSERETSASVINNLNSIFSGLELSSKTSVLVQDLPDAESFFDCQGFSSGELSGSYAQKLVFAPSSSRLKPLIVWTQDFNLPFFVSNFVFVTSPKIKYVFVYDENSVSSKSLKSRIEKLLPETINKVFVTDLAVVSEKGAYSTKVLFLDVAPQPVAPVFESIKIPAVRIGYPAKLEFFVKETGASVFRVSEKSAQYLEDATLVAAIITDNQEYYNCMLIKAFDRYKQIAYVLEQRVNVLGQALPHCTGSYTDIMTKLYDRLSAGLDESLLSELPLYVTNIREINRQLPLHSCPTIY
jgi:hypothetical protein